MIVLLDTNAYSALRRGDPLVADLVRASDRVLLSTIVVGELLYGFRRGNRFARNLQELGEFIASPFVEVCPVTFATAERFARVMESLREQGTPIPTNDVWIAAQAQELGAELISGDQHFEQVPDLSWHRVPR